MPHIFRRRATELMALALAAELTGAVRGHALGAATLDQLAGLPPDAVLVGFTPLEIRMLWTAIAKGAEAVVHPASGFHGRERAAFLAAADRLRDAGHITLPRLDDPA